MENTLQKIKLHLNNFKLSIALTILILFNILSGHTQSIGTYSFTNTAPGGYTLLTSPITATSGDDAISAAISIGFTFNFGGTNVTQFKANTNGWMTFNTAVTSTSNYSSLSSTTATNVIAGFSNDLVTTSVSYLLTGTSPNRILKIQWNGISSYTDIFSPNYVPATGTYQVWLYETTNVVEIRYGAFTAGTRTASSSVQVGLKGTSTATTQIAAANGTTWTGAVLSSASNSVVTISTSQLPPNGRMYQFSPPAPCSGAPPLSNTISSVSSACAGVSFNLSLQTPTIGTGVSYQWQLSTNGGASWGNIAGAISSSLSRTQTIETLYRCEVTCTSVGGGFTNSTPVLVPMASSCVCATYCSSNFTNVTDEHITRVVFAGIDNPSAGNTGGPVNYTGITGGSVVAGSSYSLSVTIKADILEYVYVWFDWNQDGTFANPGERFTVVNSTSSAGPHTILIPVPSGATVGSTRMRVMLAYNNTNPTPCISATWGEAEDYCISVSPPLNCSVTPTPGNTQVSLANPVCTTSSFTLSMATPPTNTINVTYQWQSSATGVAASFVNIGGATNATYVTTQTTSTYYRCVVVCNSVGTGISNPFQVISTICYCTPTYTGTTGAQPALGTGCSDNDLISNFTINGISFSSNCSPGAYSFTPSPVIGLTQGLTYPFSIQIGNPSFTTYNEGVKIWADWNDNGSFEDAGELILASATTVSGLYSGSLTIPGCANAGQHRLRVRIVWNTTNFTSCSQQGQGETEDYLVNITQVAVVPAVARNITGPSTSPCNQGALLTLASGHAGTIQWQWSATSGGPYTDFAGANQNSILVTANAAQTFYIRVQFTGQGCTPVLFSTQFTLTFTSGVLNITNSAGSTNICRGTQVTLSTTGAGPFTWSTGETGPSIAVTPLNAVSNYSVSSTNGSCVANASIILNVSGPLAQASSVNSICPGATVNLNGTLLQAVPNPLYSVSNITFAPLACPATNGPSGDDVVSAALNLGFTFNYFGVDYTQFAISTNGNIQMGNGAGNANNPSYSADWIPTNLPNASLPNNTIALAWADWNPASGAIKYGMSGTSPNRRMVVCFTSVASAGLFQGSLTGQIILYEGSNNIEFHYTSISTGLLGTPTKVAGIENQNGTVGFMPTGYGLGTWSTGNLARRFTPNLPGPYNVNGPINYAWSGTNGFSAFTQNTSNSPIGTTTYTLTVSDNTCSSTSQKLVVVNPQPTVDTYSGTPFCEGSDIQFFTTGIGTTSGGTIGSLTVTVTGPSFLDEVSWQIRNSANAVIFSGGPYAPGSYNTVTVSPAASAYPVTFHIETQGGFDDNVADYSLDCSANGVTLTSGTLNGGLTYSSPSYNCSTTGVGLTYSWTGPNSFTSSSANPFISMAGPNQSGTYTVTLSDLNGCTAQMSTDVDVNSNPEPYLIFMNPVSCAGLSNGSFQLGVNNGTPFFEYTEQNTNISNFSGFFGGLPQGTYYVGVTDLASCESVQPLQIIVTTVPNVGPSISCPSNISVNTGAGICGAVVTYTTPVGTDACPGASTVRTAGLASGSTFPLGTTLNTFVVTDAQGLTATCSFTVTVTDNTPPTALCQNVTVTLDAFGNGSTTAAAVNAGSNDACGIQSVSLSQTSFTCANVGPNTVTLTVTDNNGNVSTCNATVTVVDNTPPVALCQSITVQLNAAGNATITASQINNGSTDACGIASMSVSPSSFSCANVGGNTVVLTVTDVNGNASTCNATVTVQDNVAPVAVCQNVTVQLNASGVGSVTATQVNNGSTDACGIASMSVSPSSFSCSNVGANTVTLTVTDVNGNVSTCNATVTVEDNVAPVALCQSITVQLNAAGAATITASQIDNGSNDACGIASLSVSPSSFSCANVGGNTVVLTVTDVNGNASTCNATVTVQDNVAPVALCQNITVQLNSSGAATITASQIDNGSSDACGIASMSVSPSSFSCANVGANTVTLTVTDNNGNVSTCNASVTVEDNVAPVALCQNVTVQLNASGVGSVTAAQVNNGSTDACGIASMSVSPSTFTCANVGGNAVVLTVTDVNGNVSTCNATVTVQDNVAPIVLCQNITVQLSAAGSVSITASQINNGSTDACGIASMSVSPSSFSCANVGGNAVVLTVTDVNGNASTCNATVTVQDNVAPIALCQNITVQLNSSGAATITASQIDNGSSDACGIASMSVSPSSFSCANVGANTVTLTVTDNNGNVSTCNATVTVQDNVAPVALCQNVTVQLNASGVGSVTATQVNNGSTDACGIASMSVSPSSFTCSNVGANTVTLTVTDVNGNVSTCTSTVTVQDNVAPVALCKNVTLYLNASGTASTSAAAVNNGSNDACGIASMVLSQTNFNCTHVGANTVTLTVTDVNGNASTCTSTITVIDNIAPVITCPGPITVNNDPGVCGATINYMVTASDNCTYNVNQTAGLASGSVFPIGTTVNTFVVTDASGNSATCSFAVNITDNEAPTITNVPANFSACNPISWTPPTITDNCPGVQITSSHVPGFIFPAGTTTVTYTATDAYNQQTSASFNVTVIVPSVAATSITSNRDYNNICNGENITLTVNGGILGAGASWKWYSGSCGGSLVGTGSTITVAPTATTTYFARAEGTCNTTTCVQLQVVVSSGAPTIAPVYSVFPAFGAPGITDVLSVNPVPGATYYQWFTNNGQINGVLFNGLISPVQTAVPTVNITFVLPQSNYQIRVFAGNACGRTGQSNNHIRGTVEAPTSLTGPTLACPGQTLSYTVSAISGTNTTYNWQLIPSSAGTINGTGLTRTVTFAAGFTSAQLCVNGISNFGLAGAPLCIVISSSAPAPGLVSGPATPCQGALGQQYTISAVVGATSYQWSTTIVGATVSGTGLTGTVNFPNTAFSGTVCVRAVSACGLSAPSCKTVTSGAPGIPGPISGPTQGICGASNVNYSLATSNANSYSWTLPVGVTISGVSNSNSVNLNFGAGFTSGTITVVATYTCGTASSSLVVNGKPSIPVITPATICAGSTELYFASSTGATSYNWIITGDDYSACTNAPSCSQQYVEWSAGGGTLSVTATNSCGTSAPFNLSTNCRISEGGTMDTKVYPNPTTGLITVEFSSYAGGNYNLTVTDLSGRVVLVDEMKATSGLNRQDVDLSFANKGLYMLYVKDADGKISVTKIVVE